MSARKSSRTTYWRGSCSSSLRRSSTSPKHWLERVSSSHHGLSWLLLTEIYRKNGEEAAVVYQPFVPARRARIDIRRDLADKNEEQDECQDPRVLLKRVDDLEAKQRNDKGEDCDDHNAHRDAHGVA